jgi:hypothetical protein
MMKPSAEFPDESRPSPARMYDFYLGGHHNFPTDRAAAERVIAAFPDIPLVAQANRAFLRRAVHFLLDQGVRQFLDIGSGIPTVGNVHEVAQQRQPDARVVYVDLDEVAVTHGRALLASNPYATVLQADARQAQVILQHPETVRLIDFKEPVGVLAVALLHFIPDDAEAEQVIRSLVTAIAPGSYLVFSHALGEPTVALTPDGLERATAVYQQSTSPFTVRTRERIGQLLDGLELVDPGLVLVPLWRPEGPEDVLLAEPERASVLAAVGRRPA